jgi:phosphinothricin acetyltransferase
MAATIRLATERDAEGVLAIYAPIINETVISFEAEPPSADEMRQRIAFTLAHLPWLICEQRGEVIGYAYAGKHRERAAYQWSVEVSVYVHDTTHRLGVARALYHSLFEILRLQNFYNVYAGITLPNAASVGLHESMGFQPVGVYRAVGFKHGAWHDVGWWQLELQKRIIPPRPRIDFKTAQQSSEWQAAVARGLSCLRV